jgi:hypothetical protein
LDGSQSSPDQQILIYKAILKLIWTCRIKLWGTASNSNIEILERIQSKDLRMIADTPWCMPNTIIRTDLQKPTAKEETSHYSSQPVVACGKETYKLNLKD